MVLVQEMAVRVDMGLIGSLVDLFSPQGWDDSGEVGQYAEAKEQFIDFVACVFRRNASRRIWNLFTEAS